MDDLIEHVMSDLKEDEGFVPYAYQDSLGYWTIGYGNLIDRRKNGGISKDEALYMLKNDIDAAIKDMKTCSWFNALDEVRQSVFIELCFNIGLPSLLKFTQTIKAIIAKDYEAASMHLLNSKWRQQVGEHRSNKLAKRLVTGSYGA